jgi:hypothetical protein
MHGQQNIKKKSRCVLAQARKSNKISVEHTLYLFLCFVDRAPLYTIFQMKPTKSTLLIRLLISHLYMFWATMRPSSGELTVSMRHVWVAVWSSDQTATHTE